MFKGFYPAGQSKVIEERVFFTGATALVKGQGLCYDRDYYSTATGETTGDPCTWRDKRVELPSTTNNRWFAGVCVQDYSAKTGGRFINIYLPGSTCEIAVGLTTTIAVTRLTCSCGSGDAGIFTWEGFPGRGTALALETDTVIGRSTDGTATLDAAGTTLTKTAMFTDAVAGDYVYITAGASAAGASVVTPGRYTIATRSSANAVILSSAASSAAAVCNAYVIPAAGRTILAYLFNGEESGLQEEISPLNNAAAQSMVGGVTYVAGGYTLGTGDSTATLANGTIKYEKKGFIGLGTLTTHGWKCTVTTGKQLDKATALAATELGAAAHQSWLYWANNVWILDWNSGATLT